MADTYHLSFSIGPVQAFVAQARRTRDLWAGSWLLSCLAESALVAAEVDGGTAIIPQRAEEDCKRVTAKRSPVGGMPNRFELTFTGDNAEQMASAAANAATRAFDEAWEKVARAVWETFLHHDDVLRVGSGTKSIWDRQVAGFWEISWVVGQPDGNEQTIGRLAALRKNLRNVTATIEPGVKCSLMPTLQELSGHYGPGNADKQKDFWNAVRRRVGGLDLGDSERLCAIALIKRLFPKVIKAAIGEDIGDDLQQVSWPSTAFMAALPWLQDLDGAARAAAKSFQEACLDAGYERSETEAAHGAGIAWAVADGPIWYRNAVRNDEPGLTKPGERPAGVEKQQRAATVRALLEQQRKLYQAAAGPAADETREPVPYYALLLMDGDSMGQLLGKLRTRGGPQTLSKCLGEFARGVRNIVTKYGGRAIYAGGDDVLALLPTNEALVAADELRTSYRDAFGQEGVPEDVATISAAVVYAHWRYPLRQVLRTAHHLLDDVAKDATGRDSVAIGVILGSGLNAVWSVPWNVFHGKAQNSDQPACVSLWSVLDRFESRETDESSNPPFNASFLYLLRERFGYLLGEGQEQPGEFRRFHHSHMEASGTAVLLRDLAHAEYRRRMSKTARLTQPANATQAVIDELMSLSRQWQRNVSVTDGQRNVAITSDPNTFSFDGWRVARFLKQVKDGKVSDHD